MNEQDETPKTKRGFAAMDPEAQRQIASQGGQAAHKQGKAHQWNAEEAKEAGKKGGQNTQVARKKDRGNRRDELL